MNISYNKLIAVMAVVSAGLPSLWTIPIQKAEHPELEGVRYLALASVILVVGGTVLDNNPIFWLGVGSFIFVFVYVVFIRDTELDFLKGVL